MAALSGIPLAKEGVMRFQWNESMSVGDELLDRQHRQLLRLLSGLRMAMEEGCCEAAEVAVMEFQELAATYFANLESYIPANDLYSKVKHRQDHQAAADRIEALRKLICDKKQMPRARKSFESMLVDIVVELFRHDAYISQRIREPDRRRATRISGAGLVAEIDGQPVDVVDISVDGIKLLSEVDLPDDVVEIGLVPRIRGKVLDDERVMVSGRVVRTGGGERIIRFDPDSYERSREMVLRVLKLPILPELKAAAQ